MVLSVCILYICLAGMAIDAQLLGRGHDYIRDVLVCQGSLNQALRTG